MELQEKFKLIIRNNSKIVDKTNDYGTTEVFKLDESKLNITTKECTKLCLEEVAKELLNVNGYANYHEYIFNKLESIEQQLKSLEI